VNENSTRKSNPQKISVLIVTYNNESTIGLCLDSLLAQTIRDFEIIILDNHSTDLTTAAIKKYPNVRLFESSQNLGFAKAVNQLTETANGDYLFILNPDCYCPPQTLEHLTAFPAAHPGAISPALVDSRGLAQLSARVMPTYGNILFSRKSPLYILGLAEAADAGYLDLKSPTKVPAVSATALFISKKLFDSIGRFDERFFMFLEDIDLCRRLGDSNIDIWYLPDLKIPHVHGASSSKRSIKSLYFHHISIFKYFTKHYPNAHIKNILLLILLLGGFVISSATRLLGFRK
jgi:N-acetylglucosaminyl-diphospho-decaprenol L-rhamnosyltransferase